MSCSNCYNGCTQITSDQCVRYTGIDVPVLGIKNGDSLSYVEQALIEFLVSTLDGSGIKVDLDQSFFCDIFSSNLPKCGDLTVVDVLNTLIKTVCVIQEEIIGNGEAIVQLQNTVNEINSPYNLPKDGCLGTLPDNPTTHDVVQAVVSTLCAFLASANDTYVQLADLDTLIGQYLASQTTGGGTLMSDKMVPWAVYPYFNSDISGFDSTGRGSGVWEKVYLCNGLNGTPDLRGRALVGATAGIPGGTLDAEVNPSISGNPSYDLRTKAGTNTVQLSVEQMPSHTHDNTITVSDPGHKHGIPYDFLISGNSEGGIQGSPDWYTTGGKMTDSTTTGITVTLVNAAKGNGNAHPNYQPGMGCYYIIYIP